MLAAGGGARPVRRSRTISATASSIGASARSVTSSNLARWIAVLEHRGEIVGDARHAPRADRLDARLLDRVEHRARLLAFRRKRAVHAAIVAGEPQRHRIGMAAHDRGFGARSACAAGSGSRALPPISAGPVGGEGDLEIWLARERAHAAGTRA